MMVYSITTIIDIFHKSNLKDTMKMDLLVIMNAIQITIIQIQKSVTS